LESPASPAAALRVTADFQVLAKGFGGYQAIKVEMHDGQRVYIGASESRKDGQAAGY